MKRPDSRQKFLAAAETFGCDTGNLWAADALSLLYCSPRAFQPLVDAFEADRPGCSAQLERLAALGFAVRQPPVEALRTPTGLVPVDSGRARPRAVLRYVLARPGRTLLRAAAEDPRAVAERFPKTTPQGEERILQVLRSLEPHSKIGRPVGLSYATVSSECSLPAASAAYWLKSLSSAGLVRVLEDKSSDHIEVVPAHWRPTAALTKQLKAVSEAFPERAPDLPPIRRGAHLGDIPQHRALAAEGTDWRHDVAVQEVVGRLMTSDRMDVSRHPRLSLETVFAIALAPKDECPRNFRWVLPDPYDPRVHGSSQKLSYQPDAVFAARFGDGAHHSRCVLEYERRASRRDAWGHIEKFLAYMSSMAWSWTPGVLMFVLDSSHREKSYISLCEAFGDYLLRNPHRNTRNPLTLAVAHRDRLFDRGDPLKPSRWHRVDLAMIPPRGPDPLRCVVHAPGRAPLSEYSVHD